MSDRPPGTKTGGEELTGSGQADCGQAGADRSSGESTGRGQAGGDRAGDSTVGRAGGGRGELLRFAATGLAAYATDLAVFNALLLGAGTPSTWAKVVSSVAAIAVAFAGSRWFTWRDRRSDAPGREYALFVLFSVLAALLQLACLVVSRDLLALTSPLADNVSANVVGMAIATAFRFWTFRTYVFPVRPDQA